MQRSKEGATRDYESISHHKGETLEVPRKAVVRCIDAETVTAGDMKFAEA